MSDEEIVNRVKILLEESARKCPICQIELKQETYYPMFAAQGRLHTEGYRRLGNCTCPNCGIGVFKPKYPMLEIKQTPYASVKIGDTSYAVDASGQVYQIELETRQLESWSNFQMRWNKESYTVEVLHFIGRTGKELW